MPKMIWLYKCNYCGGKMATVSAFTRDESPPAKTIECLSCDQQTLLPVRQMSPPELDRWANCTQAIIGSGSIDGAQGWTQVGPHRDLAEDDHD